MSAPKEMHKCQRCGRSLLWEEIDAQICVVCDRAIVRAVLAVHKLIPMPERRGEELKVFLTAMGIVVGVLFILKLLWGA